MKKIRFIFVFIAFFCFFSCARKPVNQADLRDFAAPKMNAVASAKKMMTARSSNSKVEAIEQEMVVSDSYDDGATGQNPIEIKSEKIDRKFILTGNLTIEVASLSDSSEKIDAWCKKYNGYISNSSASPQNANFTVKIPSEKFDAALQEVGSFGSLRNKNVSSQDVTEQFYDLKTRLSTKYVMKENLERYLKQAKDVKDMLQIERELNNVITDIESMEGRMKRLSNQIEYSTIYINLCLPYGKNEHGFEMPNIGDGARHFLFNIAAFYGTSVLILFYVIICGIPVIAILGFLFWLLIGKVGLLKKIYDKLKK